MIDFKQYRVNKDLHRKPVKVRGIEDEVHVLRLPASENRRYWAEVSSQDIDVRAEAGFSTLQKAIRNPDGTEAGTLDDYRHMDIDLLKELIRVYQEVNAVAKDDDLGNA